MINDLEKQLKSALKVDVPLDARDNLRAKVMSSIEQQAMTRKSFTRRRRFWRPQPVFAGAVLSVFLLFAGTAMAASGSHPGNWLYPLKQKTEEARVFAAVQDIDRAGVEIERAGKRIDEIISVVDEGKPEYVDELTGRYNDHLLKAEEHSARAAASGEDISHLEEMMSAMRIRYNGTMRIMLDKLPDDMAVAMRREMGDEPGDEQSSGSASGTPMPAPQAMPAPGMGGDGMSSGGNGGGSMDDGTSSGGGSGSMDGGMEAPDAGSGMSPDYGGDSSSMNESSGAMDGNGGTMGSGDSGAMDDGGESMGGSGSAVPQQPTSGMESRGMGSSDM